MCFARTIDAFDILGCRSSIALKKAVLLTVSRTQLLISRSGVQGRFVERVKGAILKVKVREEFVKSRFVDIRLILGYATN